MRKFLVFTTCFVLAACKYKDHNSEIVKPQKPAPADTLAVIKGNAASLVDQYLGRMVNDSAFSGAVFISRNDTVLLCKGYGIADSGTMAAFTPNTLVGTDAFDDYLAAAAVMNLYAQGKLNFGDRLNTYFPEAPAGKKNITVHQLLTHTSGLFPCERSESLDTIWHAPVVPKQGAVYSSHNTCLIKNMVQRVDHTSFSDYEKNELHLPFKPKSTVSISAKDIFNWIQKFEHGEIIADSLVRIMQTAYVPETGTGGLSFFGYGCRIVKTRADHTMISIGSAGSKVMIFPEDHLVFGLMSAHNNTNTSATLPAIVQLFFDGYISTNAPVSLQGFESRGAKILYTLIMEKGETYFTEHALEILSQEGLPENEMFFIEAGQKLIREKKWKPAKTLYLLLSGRFPENIVAFNDLGEVYFEMKETSKAKTCFERALKINPDNDRAKRWLEKVTR